MIVRTTICLLEEVVELNLDGPPHGAVWPLKVFERKALPIPQVGRHWATKSQPTVYRPNFNKERTGDEDRSVATGKTGSINGAQPNRIG